MAEHVEDSAHTTGYDARRLHTNDMELGVTDAVQRHVRVSYILAEIYLTSDIAGEITFSTCFESRLLSTKSSNAHGAFT